MFFESFETFFLKRKKKKSVLINIYDVKIVFWVVCYCFCFKKIKQKREEK
jgi:hypothetical protein